MLVHEQERKYIREEENKRIHEEELKNLCDDISIIKADVFTMKPDYMDFDTFYKSRFK